MAQALWLKTSPNHHPATTVLNSWYEESVLTLCSFSVIWDCVLGANVSTLVLFA